MRKMDLKPVIKAPTGTVFYAVTFEKEGWVWHALNLMTRDEAENECDCDWEDVCAVRLYQATATEPERPFDPFRDYGVCNADFL